MGTLRIPFALIGLSLSCMGKPGDTTTLAHAGLILPAITTVSASVYVFESPGYPAPSTLTRIDADSTALGAPAAASAFAFRADADGVYAFNPCSISVFATASAAFSTLPVPGCVDGPLAASATELFWFDGANGLVAMSKVGGAPRVVAGPGPLKPNRAIGLPIDLVVDAQYAYWSDRDPDLTGDSGVGIVARASLAGGPVERLAAGLSNPTGVAVTDSSLFWVEAGSAETPTGVIKRYEFASTQTVVLVGGEAQPSQLVVTSSNLFWLANQSVRTANQDGTNAASMTTSASAFAVDASYVYWVNAADTEVLRSSRAQ